LIKFGIVLMSHSRGIFFICIYKYWLGRTCFT
jgi:hypothetical protein